MERMFESPIDLSGYTLTGPDGNEVEIDRLLDEMRDACLERVEYLIDELPNASEYQVALYVVLGMVLYEMIREEDRTMLKENFSQMFVVD